MRLAREAVAQDEVEGRSEDLDAILESNSDEDKIYGAMGIAKTIGTVRFLYYQCRTKLMSWVLQIVSAVESAPEILTQVQEVIIPIIRYSFENKIIGMFLQLCEMSCNTDGH